MAAVLALVAALAYGAADFYGGLATRRLPATDVVLRSNSLAFPGLLVANLLVGGTWTGHDAAIGALAGVAATAGLLLLFRALAEGTMSVVAPITAVLAAVVPMAVGLGTGERPAPLAVAGLPVALVAVLLLAAPPRAGGGRLVVPAANLVAALGAGLAFGIFFVALDATSHDGGLWPVVVSQAAGITLLSTVKLFGGAAAAQPEARPVPSGPSWWRPGCSAPWRTCRSCWPPGAACSPWWPSSPRSYPASTLLLARLVLGERIAGIQRFGAVLAVAAVVLVSLP